MVLPTAQRDRLKRRAAAASVITALLLIVLKVFAWWQSEALAMLGSLADSSLDLMASLVTFIAVRAAIKPPDHEHRFGHGKAEALSALFQSGLMAIAAIFLLRESLMHAGQPRETGASHLVIGVSLAAIVITLILVMYQRRIIRQTESLAIAGDHLHYKGDLAMNLGVVLAAVLVGYGWREADTVAGAAIALYIAYSAYGVAGPATDMLMDRELSTADRHAIAAIAAAVPGVRGWHNLRTRRSGATALIQLHIEVDGDLSVRDGHAVADRVRTVLADHFDSADILIHVDPA